MTQTRVDFIPDEEPTQAAPTRTAHLLREADARIRVHMEQQRGHSKGFVASDFALVSTALDRIVAEGIAQGPLFCEWGSGFGVVAMMASILGFEACGIECQSDLVLAAEELAEYVGCDVRFAHGTFVSAGDAELIESAKHIWWQTAECSAYEEFDLESRDIDVFFVYPWPGEESIYDALFMRQASIGALLLTYHDGTGVLVQRKAGKSGAPEVIGWY